MLQQSGLYSSYSKFLAKKEIERELSQIPNIKPITANPDNLESIKKRFREFLKREKEEEKKELREKNDQIKELKNYIEDLECQIEDIKKDNHELITENLKKEAVKNEVETLREDQETEIIRLENKTEEMETLINAKNVQINNLSKEVKAQSLQLKEQAVKSREISPKLLASFYTSCGHAYPRFFTKDSSLELYFDTQVDKVFLKELVSMRGRLPPLKQIWTDKFKDNHYMVNFFLEHCFPTSLRSFSFNWWGEGLEMRNHIDSLTKAIPFITEEISFYSFKISLEEFETIINTAKCKKLIFWRCIIDTSSSLSLKNTTLTHLSFQGSGKDENSNWLKDEDKFRNIMQSINDSPFGIIIDEINVHQCGLDIDRMREITEEEGMQPECLVEGKEWKPIK